ncbi:hypothetical protein [Paenibacillus apiarius]|uniref:Uncharacterized protein n=1 Tax=Paenibacillus apiarius TaxID=46240 RepID=A0ABT4DTM8_9BACL|nr:hypothetical protein [Paenibacillus apiarius]MCY9515551.1 hypothetical protein [Paenibacillus apiarius]MCY9519376.1 hypothetical protein [Paenibacillus apiarius]MCY9551012.1 hypothetical protein [Paenibacillus apiarius]MCY9558896.1 hypothetical protein [Paenibacillus apiarius]MCY9683627.1 hypothetical protein [Paenibacillus apiarius]
MNKNKKFNRIVITIAIMTLLGTSNAIVLPPTVSADSSNEINDIIKQCSKPITGMHVPADLHESLRCIYLNPKVYEKPGKELVGEQINIKDFTIDSVNLFLKKKPEYIVKAKGDPQHNETENLFFGINQLVK